jgi:hypothetical protein
MTDPHANAPHENPEDHIGEEIPDPWDDPKQKDWATETVDPVILNPPVDD